MQKINTFTTKLLKNISQSVKDRKQKQKKTREEVAPSNEQMLSNVMNFHIIPSRNPYLLPIPKNNKNNLTHQIIKNLHYKSSYELTWDNGTTNYFDTLEEFFYLGLDYLNLNNENVVTTALLSDLRFAKAKAYKNTHSIYRKEKYNKAKINAKAYLYETLWLDFAQLHNKYFQNLGTFKLTQNIEQFFKTDFFNLLKKFNTSYNPTSTFNLINSIYKTIEQQKVLVDKPLPEEIVNNSQLIEHGTGFIDALIENQILSTNFISNKFKQLKNNAKYYK